MRQRSPTYSGFSIIEVLVGIFVFSLGLVSIYALLAASLSINERNKNSIIASNLAREQIELIRNIRDTNYETLKVWNQFNLPNQPTPTDLIDSGKVFSPWVYYTLMNDSSVSWIMTKVNKLGTSIPEWKADIVGMNIYRLCLDSERRYVYCPWGDETPFYRYLKVEELLDENGLVIDNAYKVISKVIWYKRWYYEFDIQTVITDWRRI